MKREKAKTIINNLVSMRESASDEQASKSVALYPTLKYDGKLIKSSTRINWNGTIKRASIDIWDMKENNPDNAPTLWADISYRDGYRIIPEVIDVSTVFSKGEIGWWNNILYESLIDSNVWTPEQNSNGWKETKS